MQSLANWQLVPLAQASQASPPQSTPVSLPSFSPSLHWAGGVAHT